MTLVVQREIQLDAAHLDDAYFDMLHEQLKSIFDLFPADSRVRRVVDSCAAELQTALHVAIWWFTIAQDSPAPGLGFMGLQYRNEYGVDPAQPSRMNPPLRKWQKAGFLIFAVGFRWAWARGRQTLERIRPQLEQRRRIISRMPHGEAHDAAMHRLQTEEGQWHVQLLFAGEKAIKLVKLISLANLIAFLYNGKYRSALDRLLGARLVYSNRHSPRNIPFDFMNQQLVFDELTSFVKFLVPYTRALHSTRIMKWVLGAKSKTTAPVPGGMQVTEGHSCSVCASEDPIMPHMGKCSHVGCYVCLMNGMLANRNFACPQCGTALGQLQPWKPP